MRDLRLSVVLCTYNGAAYLPDQLDSLLGQERLPDEVVVGDDASTDESWNIVQAFAERAGTMGVPVRAKRRSSNIGFVKNFSEALLRASGDVLFLCDQDDVWRADKLAVMESCFVADPDLLLLCTDAELIDACGQLMNRRLFEALELSDAQLQAVHDGHAFEDVLLHRTLVTGATAAMRRHLVGLALPVEPGWIHDEWLAVVAAALGRVEILEQPLIEYRQHGANQVGVPMRERTWVDKWRDLMRPRGDLLRAEAERLRAVEERLGQLPVPNADERLRLAKDRRSHFMRRAEIGRLPHLRRIAPIWHEASSGDYQRYSTGIRSMLRDVLRHD